MPSTMSASSTPGPSGTQSIVGESLYEWCRREHEYGYVFQQEELLDSGIIPNRDLLVLLSAAQYLVGRHLLKIHDIKGQEGAAWELIAPEIAKSYHGLTTDEQMVYALIEGVGTTGIWTKTIKARLGAHAKVLDRVYKSLESRQLIKQMKSVKNPGRKMYILFGLQPSEEATGGAWFTEGRLDTEMIDAISGFVEQFCSRKSWREVEDEDDEEEYDHNRMGKSMVDGFEASGKGKGKAVKAQDETQEEAVAPARQPKTKQPRYEPYEAGYTGYPTVRDVSKEILNSNVMESGQALPEPALAQLMDVMVYDDRLFKMTRDPRSGEAPDVPGESKVFMYRSFKSLNVLRDEVRLRKKLGDGSRSARRVQELEDIGRGGTSEVPCLGCPNFDICGEGGPVNADTCVYFEDWYNQMEEADRELEDPWPNTRGLIKPKTTTSSRR